MTTRVDPNAEICMCGDSLGKHPLVWLGGDTKEPGPCSVCPCRIFRRVAG